MKFGAHMSAAGGVDQAYGRAAEIDCETMLIFTKSNRQWKAKPLTADEIEAFKTAGEAHPSVAPVAVHASYLINIASPKTELWEKSYQALKVEVERADALGIPLLTFHPGSHVGSGEEAGLDKIVEALQRLLVEMPGCQTVVCLETMAGQGTNLGYKFEHLAYILDKCDRPDRLGVCLDTCHIFAAGYDFRTPAGYEATMAEFDRTVGLDQIKFFHFNDSKFGLGEQKDRHEHIGRGEIGREGFANFINDPRWAAHAAHLETPKTEEDDNGAEIEMDPINLAVLKELRK
ncbi:MAG: deoxyribonuclease IV [Anaerolineales bacterium]|nr:deoxyribonuclease IV [Anaerolineales bacterium]